MAQAQDKLEQLKASMSSKQRADMAEVISNEIKRRQLSDDIADVSSAVSSTAPRTRLSKKSSVGSSRLSGGLSSSALEDVVNESSENVRKLRLKKLEQQLAELKGDVTTRDVAIAKCKEIRSGAFKRVLPSANTVLLYSVVGFGFLKILFSTGVVDIAIAKSLKGDVRSEVQSSADNIQNSNFANSKIQMSAANNKIAKTSENIISKDANNITLSKSSLIPNMPQAQLLEQLDARRVSLEERSLELDAREKKLDQESATLSEKLAELRSISTKLETLRKEKDQRYESRIEQLADVYGSMAPQQAAPLIAKLEDETALGLLQRMPGKRMGQILSLMNEERAVELTKRLTDRKVL